MHWECDILPTPVHCSAYGFTYNTATEIHNNRNQVWDGLMLNWSKKYCCLKSPPEPSHCCRRHRHQQWRLQLHWLPDTQQYVTWDLYILLSTEFSFCLEGRLSGCAHTLLQMMWWCAMYKSNKHFRTDPEPRMQWGHQKRKQSLARIRQHIAPWWDASTSQDRNQGVFTVSQVLSYQFALAHSGCELRSGLIGPLQLFGPDIEL